MDTVFFLPEGKSWLKPDPKGFPGGGLALLAGLVMPCSRRFTQEPLPGHSEGLIVGLIVSLAASAHRRGNQPPALPGAQPQAPRFGRKLRVSIFCEGISTVSQGTFQTAPSLTPDFSWLLSSVLFVSFLPQHIFWTCKQGHGWCFEVFL